MNAGAWERKPTLRKIYRTFHERIAAELNRDAPGRVVEIGAGIGNMKQVIPDCIATDLFPNPWIDRVENVNALSFADGAVSNLILFDVFHHLRYPGTALREMQRVLCPRGRAVIFEPAASVLGLLVFGLLHPEPLALRSPIAWEAPEGWTPADDDYYAAQGNASRVFLSRAYRDRLDGWRVLSKKRFSAVSYVLSGGYSKPQLYPDAWYPLMRGIDRCCDCLPWLFATRLMVVLEKGTNDA